MLIRIRRFLTGPSSLVFAGNMSRSVLGLLINVLVARWLGPGDFGLYYLFMVTMIAVFAIIGEGLDPAVVRSYAHSAEHNAAHTPAVVGSALALRLWLGIPLVLLGVIGGSWFAEQVLGDPRFTMPLKLGVVAGIGAALASFALALFQARHQFAWR
ncbi:MAG: oligosaccharide flippase family protein, partial [Gammaproteobacteria bacterium]|nr:oligosaccharide flippase family protein [Gammaproteobacteria bacterium]